jgi:glycosyltransferase 2 family protein
MERQGTRTPPAAGTGPDAKSPEAGAGGGRKRVARALLGWAVSAAFLLGLLYTVPFRVVWDGLRALDPWAALAAAALVLVTLRMRGERWSLLLSSGERVPPAAAAEVATLGLALNAVLPGRVGEVARVAIANRRFRVGIAFAAATVVAERLLDGLTLFLFLGLALLALPSIGSPGGVTILGAEVSGTALTHGFVTLGVACLVLASGIVAVGYAGPRRWLARVARVLPGELGERAARRLEGLLDSLADGVAGLRRSGTSIRLVLYSVAIWLTIAAAYWVVAQSMDGLDLSVGEVLIVTAVSVAASSLPSAPGAWGVFEAGGVLALRTVQPGLDVGLAIAYMIAIHVCQYAPTVALGYVLWWIERRRGGRPRTPSSPW